MNVVMLVRDRPNLTEQALQSFFANTDVPWNLTVVDDGSDLRTTAVLRKALIGRPECSLIRVDGSGHILANLKSLGVYWSGKRFGRGGWLYLSDNDVYFTPGWASKLTNLLAKMEAPPAEFALLGGQNHPYHQPITEPHEGAEIREYGAVAGTSWLMRWDTWIIFGPLEGNAPGVCQSEDHAFCQEVRKKGYRVGAIWPPVVLDTGITQTGGTPSPGAEVKERVKGVLYE